MKWKVVFIITIFLLACKTEPKYYEHTKYGHMIKELDGVEYAKNYLPKIGDFDKSLGGKIIRVNIVGERKGSVPHWNIASGFKKVEEGTEDLTYIYYSYTVKRPLTK